MGFYGEGLYIHYDLLTILERFAPDKVNILHLGAGCGATLLEMKRCYRDASLFGAEINEKALLQIGQLLQLLLHMTSYMRYLQIKSSSTF